MVEDELPPVRPARRRASWTGLHRPPSGRGRSGAGADRPPPESDDDFSSPDASHADASADASAETSHADAADIDAESSAPTSGEPAIGTAAVPAVGSAVVRRDVSPGQPRDLSIVDEHSWLDQDAGPVVRPYTLVGGRSRPFTSGLGLLTHVEALYAPDADLVALQPEHRAILSLTRTAISMAELAARLDLPVGVVRVLVGDLVRANLVSTFEADAAVRAPSDDILQAVIDGLRAL